MKTLSRLNWWGQFDLNILDSATMSFPFVYRTADIYFCAILAERELWDISCLIHKSELHICMSGILYSNMVFLNNCNKIFKIFLIIQIKLIIYQVSYFLFLLFFLYMIQIYWFKADMNFKTLFILWWWERINSINFCGLCNNNST